MIDRFMTQPEIEPNPLAPATSLLSTTAANTGNLTTCQPSKFPDAVNPTAPQLPTFPANTDNPTTSKPSVPPDASTPVTSQPVRSLITSVTFATPQYTAAGVSTSPTVVPPVQVLRPEADEFSPMSSSATVYHEIRQSPLNTTLNRTLPTENVHQITEALAKVTQLQRLPQAKPDVFTGEEIDTKFFIWDTAFDALVDSAPISAQQKLYLLYQYLDGKAKKVVEQLQYMVGANPELAYREARKTLKQRFGRSALIVTNFETKLANWPKISQNDAKGIREFSDFLQQVEIASDHMPTLNIF